MNKLHILVFFTLQNNEYFRFMKKHNLLLYKLLFFFLLSWALQLKAQVKPIALHPQNPHYFVFSDDKSWVKENLQFDCPVTFVSHNGPEKNYEDLRLMSICKHHIIANSTFSWWGAWLNTNQHKKIISPLNWFSNKQLNDSTGDLIPETWVRI